MRTAPIKEGETIIENEVLVSAREDTGYPYSLTEEEVTKMIYFFGARRANNKALGNSAETRDFTTDEKRMVEKMCGWFSFSIESPSDRVAAYRTICGRYKVILDFLKTHPAFITKEIKMALEECGYKRILSNIVMVVTEDGKIRPRVVTEGTKKHTPPIGQIDSLMWEFQNVALDKLRMIVDSITPQDVKKSNLGMKSKALRDIYSVIHMVRLGNKNPNLTLVNVNVNAEPKEKMASYGAYIQKNRESNG